MTNKSANKPKYSYKNYTCIECGHRWRKRFYFEPSAFDLMRECPRCRSRTGFPKEKIIEDYD